MAVTKVERNGINDPLVGSSLRIFQENDQTVTASYTLPEGRNAMTVGPVTVNNGVTVTIPSGSVWVII
jgi:hypothetical protein